MGLNHQTFIEIDVKNGKIIRKIDLTEQLKRIKNIPNESPNYLFIRTSVCQNGLIYFMALNEVVGIFDPEKGLIIDKYIFKFAKKGTFLKPGKENLQIKDKEIYILDSADTLHVLERE